MFGESESTLQRIPVTETSFTKDGLVPNKDYQLQVGVEEEGIVSETLAKFHFRTASNERWQEFENLRREDEARTEALKKLNLRRDSALKNRNEIAEKLTVKKRMWKAMEEKEPQIQDIESDLKQLWSTSSFTLVQFKKKLYSRAT
uniref:Fibronectin type-III domain-containing protein n=1 Tax=Angiostrongylus cantonensis TaxID=6313 RepID=A0A0K0CTM5_ANGCA